MTQALGRGVGGHNAYWVWLVNIIDASIYPQLLLGYLRRAVPMDRRSEVLTSLGMVAAVSAVSLLGVRWVAEREETTGEIERGWPM